MEITQAKRVALALTCVKFNKEQNGLGIVKWANFCIAQKGVRFTYSTL